MSHLPFSQLYVFSKNMEFSLLYFFYEFLELYESQSF